MSEFQDPNPNKPAPPSKKGQSASRIKSSSTRKSDPLPLPTEQQKEKDLESEDLHHAPKEDDPSDPTSTEGETEVTQIQEIRSVRWRGPLPPPAAFREFENVIPGSADRILRMAEIEQQHHIACERLALPAKLKAHAVGQCLGGCVLLGALAVAGLAIWVRASWPVPVFIVTAIATGSVPALIQNLLRKRASKKTDEDEEEDNDD
jgi:uncharacterized membrane protein